MRAWQKAWKKLKKNMTKVKETIGKGGGRFKALIGLIIIIIGFFIMSTTITSNAISAGGNAERLMTNLIGIVLIAGGFFIEYKYLKEK